MLTLSTLAPVAIAAVLMLGSLAVGLVIRRVLIPWLALAAARTVWHADELLLVVQRGPITLWTTLLGAYVATLLTTLPGTSGEVVRQVLLVLLMLSVTWSLGRLAAALMRRRARALGGLPAVNLVSNFVQFLVVLLGVLIVLQKIGISIAPLLTALGVGGLAVGLALQDTLANLFAGVHILASKQVRPGDFVRLESGEEGYVQDVTWRYTTIRQLPNNVTIVPNAKLASAVITNFYLPDPEMAVLVPVGVGYDSDLELVERVTVAVGKEVMAQVQGGIPEFEPFIRFNAFGDSSIAFTVILRGREVVDQHLIRHEFVKRLHRRYRVEGIEIPFPTRTVHLRTDEPRAITT